MEYPPVTLYIPAYNAAHYLQETLPVICSLDYQNLAVIYIINDGSNDTDKLKELASQYEVELVNKSQNEGLAAARNTALSLCKTPLLASLDADCLPGKDWLKELVKGYLQTQNNNVAGVGGRLEEKFKKRLPDLFRSRHMVQHHGTNPLFDPDFLAGNNTLFKTEALKTIKGYPEEGIYRTNHEDYAVSQRLKKNGYHLYYVPSALVLHLRQDSLSSIFNTFWRWYYLFHPEPRSIYNILNKFRRQWVHHAFPWFIQDIRAGKWKLASTDLIFPFYQSWYDWKYFYRSKNNEDSTN